ncbi:MAG TPA: hypothetical protein PLA18_01910, partial [Deltaproteobacteria bacterium]|nr:hypothetical protein [Deltaproteobacteria bacterium]
MELHAYERFDLVPLFFIREEENDNPASDGGNRERLEEYFYYGFDKREGSTDYSYDNDISNDKFDDLERGEKSPFNQAEDKTHDNTSYSLCFQKLY